MIARVTRDGARRQVTSSTSVLSLYVAPPPTSPQVQAFKVFLVQVRPRANDTCVPRAECVDDACRQRAECVAPRDHVVHRSCVHAHCGRCSNGAPCTSTPTSWCDLHCVPS